MAAMKTTDPGLFKELDESLKALEVEMDHDSLIRHESVFISIQKFQL